MLMAVFVAEVSGRLKMERGISLLRLVGRSAFVFVVTPISRSRSVGVVDFPNSRICPVVLVRIC